MRLVAKTVRSNDANRAACKAAGVTLPLLFMKVRWFNYQKLLVWFLFHSDKIMQFRSIRANPQLVSRLECNMAIMKVIKKLYKPQLFLNRMLQLTAPMDALLMMYHVLLAMFAITKVDASVFPDAEELQDFLLARIHRRYALACLNMDFRFGTDSTRKWNYFDSIFVLGAWALSPLESFSMPVHYKLMDTEDQLRLQGKSKAALLELHQVLVPGDFVIAEEENPQNELTFLVGGGADDAKPNNSVSPEFKHAADAETFAKSKVVATLFNVYSKAVTALMEGDEDEKAGHSLREVRFQTVDIVFLLCFALYDIFIQGFGHRTLIIHLYIVNIM
jgi:hypothetical protein